MNWIISSLICASPIVFIESLHRKNLLKREISRKSIHILGSIAAIAITPLLNLQQIALLGIFFAIFMSIIRLTNCFRALYQIDRRSLGEIFFPLGVSLSAVIGLKSNSLLVYIYGLLVLGLADASASLIGQKYAKKKYNLLFLDYKKSYLGSFAMFISAFIIGLIITITYGNLSLNNLAFLSLISLILSATESQSPYGIDNIVVPFLASLLYGMWVL